MLTLRIKEGEFLKNYESFGKVNPFVMIKIGEINPLKTCVSNKFGVKPKWNYILENYPITTTLQSIFLECQDYDPTNDELIGTSELKISEIENNEYKNFRYLNVYINRKNK